MRLFAVQIAKAAGAHVTGVASGAKADLVRQIGADRVIDYRTQDFEVEVKRLTDGRGVDIVLDAVGGDTGARSLEIMKARGIVVSIVGEADADKAAARAALAAVRDADLLVFVSANAVQYAFPLMPGEIPLDLDIAAIGQATARKLEEIGLQGMGSRIFIRSHIHGPHPWP